MAVRSASALAVDFAALLAWLVLAVEVMAMARFQGVSEWRELERREWGPLLQNPMARRHLAPWGRAPRGVAPLR